MNWVGGSRKRIVFTKERRKQKDFFEKEKLKSRMKVLRQSPLKHSAVSLDLLNLHIVNQISIKKNNSDRVQKPVHVDINQIPGRWRNLELPKTPEHKPPKPFFDDIHKRLQKEVLENRRKYLSEKENLQFQVANNTHEESWFSNAAHGQRNFSDPEVDKPLALYFQNLNSPEYSNSFRKSPMVAADKDLENGNRREPMFGVTHYREMLNAIQDTQPLAALFEDENHLFLTTPSSECHHSFSNNNIINQPFIHSVDVNRPSSMYGLNDVKEMPQISSCAKRCPTERELESIFTAPEQIYSQNTQSFSTLDQEPIKNQLKDYYIQDRNPVILSKQQEDATISKSAGGFTSQPKKIKTVATMQNYLNKSRKDVLAELNLNHLHIFGLEETEEEVCSNYSQSSKPAGENDDTSQLSSQSPSYSPEQTEKCASTTSDESAEEDQDGNMSSYYKNYIPRNDGNMLAVLGSQRSWCNCHLMDMPVIHRDPVTRDGPNVCTQLKPTVDLRKYDRALPSQITSHASLKIKHTYSKASHNAWSQTEKCAWETEKSDAAVQCELTGACCCKNEVSSVHSAEMVTSKTETTGGQSVPADRAAFQTSSTSSAILVEGLPSETEPSREHSKMSIGILNYISITKDGET